MLSMKDEEKNFDWVQRELQVFSDLYDKITDEFEKEDEDVQHFTPDPLTFFREDKHKTDWEQFKANQVQNFKTKHKESIQHLDDIQEKNFDRLAMNDEEKLEFFLKEDARLTELRASGEKVFEPPQEYYQDLKSLRGFFNNSFAVYMSLGCKIIDVILDDFEYFNLDLTDKEDKFLLKDRLTNQIKPFGNKTLLHKHFKECDGCESCFELYRQHY